MCVLFDLEKAYDTCWKHLIMKQLHKFGLRGNLPIIIQDFLSNRNFRVKVEDQLSDVYEQENGTPQGGVLSPLCWNVPMDELLELLNELDGITGIGLSDDLASLLNGIDTLTLSDLMQQALNKAQPWLTKYGLSISASKSAAVLFTNKKKWTQHPITQEGETPP